MFIAFFVRHFAFAVAAMRSAPVDLTAPLVDTGYRPAVSVLVACKDEEATVEALVASLAALDYPDDLIEVIVVDDGSIDRTGEILDRLAQRGTPAHRASTARPGPGGGKSGALNAALELVRSEIVVVFDADHRPLAGRRCCGSCATSRTPRWRPSRDAVRSRIRATRRSAA